MGTEHRTIMRSTEKENFLDHIKNLAFGRGQPLPRALWDPKTKRFTISIMIQQLKICHASLVQLDLLPAQCNYKDSWQSHLGILNFAFCILCVYPILYIAYRLYCSAFISCSGDFKPRMNQSHVTTFESLRKCGLWQHSFQVKGRCRVPKKTFCLWYWEAQNRILFRKRLETSTRSSHWEIKLLIEGCVCESCSCCRWCHWFCEQSSGVITSALSASPLTTSH